MKQGSFQTTLEKLENEDFTAKMRQIFSVLSTPEKFENATIIGYFEFVFKENHVINVTLSFSKCFPSTLKRKASVFKFLRFEERFRKAPISQRISVDGIGQTVAIELRFQILSAWYRRGQNHGWYNHRPSSSHPTHPNQSVAFPRQGKPPNEKAMQSVINIM